MAEIDQQLEDERNQGYCRIGEFGFWFSQLEFTIRARLAAALSLPDNQFDIVISPYDFAMLCTVSEKLLSQQFPEKAADIEKVFKRCRAINNERVGIAHGTWTHGTQGIIARQVPRGSLKARYLYENPQALAQLTQKTRELMPEVMQLGGTAPEPGAKTSRSVRPVRQRQRAPKS
jgi:hypothetical protein